MGPGRAGITYRVCHFICRCLAAVYCRHEAVGRENVPAEGGFVLAANHVSYLDPVLVGVLVPRPIYFVARRSLFRFWLFGSLIRSLNAVPVDRERLNRDTYRDVLARLREGEGVLVFPEGTRSRDGALGRLKKGVIHLARKAGVPVVPAYVEGAHRVLGRGRWFPRPRKTRVHFGEPLDVSGDVDVEEDLARLRTSLEALGNEKCSNGRELAPAG